MTTARRPSSERIAEMIGCRFGKLTIIARGPHVPYRAATVIARCDCGVEHQATAWDIRAGKVVSCGCHGRRSKLTHGAARFGRPTDEYTIWLSMKRRCDTPTNNAYANYGGRGITVCDRWRESFAAFLEDMGLRPSKTHSIDRIDNDGHYEPSNCRLATQKEQHRNTRSNVRYVVFGETLCIAAIAEKYGIHRDSFLRRIKAGMTPEMALRTEADKP